jgi:hypothetical protein
MKYCSNCGASVNENAVVCVSCGAALANSQLASQNDSGGFGYALLGFFIPVVGLILYLIWKDSKPKSASAAGKGALTSVISVFVLYFLLFLLLLS